jgi:hypothetical protein
MPRDRHRPDRHPDVGDIDRVAAGEVGEGAGDLEEDLHKPQISWAVSSDYSWNFAREALEQALHDRAGQLYRLTRLLHRGLPLTWGQGHAAWRRIPSRTTVPGRDAGR